MFDFIIRHAEIIDGSGSPGYIGDIAVKDGRIAAIGKVGGDAARIIDAKSLVAAPGFIDIHSHTDSALFIDPRAESKITQGITTEVCGQCGFSAAPCLDESSRAELESWRRKHGIEADWRTLDEMLSALERRKIGINFATLVGHSNLRAAVVGLVNRDASPHEIDEMKSLASRAMEQGAFGLSTGLIYPPSCYAKTSELVELAKAVAAYGGIYSSHIRNEQGGLVEAVEEAIQIGMRSGASVQIAHHKACDRPNWGKVKMTLAMIRESREIGMDLNVDQYPYIAGATSLGVLIPAWAHEGGAEAVLERITSMRHALLDYLKSMGGDDESPAEDSLWAAIIVSSVHTEHNRHCEGMSIRDIASERGVKPAEAVLDLLSEEKLSVGMIQFGQCEEDVKMVMRSDAAMVGTDASARSTAGPLSRGKPHPRAFGTFPRILGRYVRDQKVIPLEFAIRKMTSMPARKLGLADRGTLVDGAWADIVLFDPNEIIDTATYENPHQVSRGIHYVFLNGRIAVERGELTSTLAGRVLRGGSKQKG
ncbi:MAG: D-aminoacylase [Armatimonadetes bacterium]|nr:D-aminoacylase [Armatimonadota bacterium]